jgi:hypothetical protein
MKSGNVGQNERFASPLTVSTPLRPVFKTSENLPRYGRSEIRRNVALGNLFWFAVLLMVVALVFSVVLRADTVPVRHREGLVHGFLVLRTLDGEIIANGDQTQVARGDRITSRLVFHFKDGSLHEETAEFSQQGTFRLLKDHLVQKGPSFKEPTDTTLDATTGQFVNSYTDEKGQSKVITEKVDAPPDVANGLILTLLKNLRPGNNSVSVSMVAATPKPRVVKLVITPGGTQTFSVGGQKREATDYVIKVDLKGIAGVVAPLVGKEPPDTHVWIMGGEAPAFVRMEGALYNGGPIWRIELASPAWPESGNPVKN